MYNKNGCSHRCGLSIGVWHVDMVTETISKELRAMQSIPDKPCYPDCPRQYQDSLPHLSIHRSEYPWQPVLPWQSEAIPGQSATPQHTPVRVSLTTRVTLTVLSNTRTSLPHLSIHRSDKYVLPWQYEAILGQSATPQHTPVRVSLI